MKCIQTNELIDHNGIIIIYYYYYYPDHHEWDIDEVRGWALNHVGVDVDILNIDGAQLSGLKREDFMSAGLTLGASNKLLTAISRLWRNITIHGVIFAPADGEKSSEIYTVAGGGSILVLRGNDARSYLGGLNQLYRYMV